MSLCKRDFAEMSTHARTYPTVRLKWRGNPIVDVIFSPCLRSVTVVKPGAGACDRDVCLRVANSLRKIDKTYDLLGDSLLRPRRCVTLTRTLRGLQRRPVTNTLPEPVFLYTFTCTADNLSPTLKSEACVCVCVCVCSRECVLTRTRVSRLVFRSGNRFLSFSATLSFSYSTTRLFLSGRVYTGSSPHTPVWLPSILADCGSGGRVPGPEELDPLSQTKTVFSRRFSVFYTSLYIYLHVTGVRMYD